MYLYDLKLFGITMYMMFINFRENLKSSGTPPSLVDLGWGEEVKADFGNIETKDTKC